jgi:hypothetical protein
VLKQHQDKNEDVGGEQQVGYKEVLLWFFSSRLFGVYGECALTANVADGAGFRRS